MRKRDETAGLVSLLFLEAGAALLWGAVVAAAIADRRVVRRLEPVATQKSPSVTLIVPARNEVDNIGAWLDAARRQTHTQLRIIVADDGSNDGTSDAATIAAQGDERVEVMTCPSPPPGWVGKPWAAYHAARRARSKWLLFSDADMRMRPDTVASALSAARLLDADALSLTATLECGTWLECQIMPLIAALVFAANPVCLVHDDRFATALMWGGFILARRSAYFRIGGHAAVRNSIVEDRDLAERLKAFGYRIRLLNGSDFIRVRMYRGGAQMWEGWRKNFFEGVRRRPWGAAVVVLASVAMLILPLPVLLMLGARSLRRRLSKAEKKLALVCGISFLSFIGVRTMRDPLIGVATDAQSILAMPIAGGFVAAVMAASAWRIISGRGQTWKGRTIR